MQRITFTTIFIAASLVACSSSPNKNEDLGYKGYGNEGETVEETLIRLKSEPNIKIRTDRGWTIVTSDAERTVWSFAPKDNPAYPSYVKRKVVEKDGTVYVDTSAKCGAEKSFCDKMVRDFIDLNNKIRENMGTQ